MAKQPDTTIAIKEVRTKPQSGVVRKRTPADHKGGWQYRLNLPDQPAQRCPACIEADRSPAFWWLDRRRLKTCPTCGGELDNVRARRQKCVGGFRTQKDALAALEKARVDRREGNYHIVDTSDARMTLNEFLVDVWLPWVETQVKPTTALSYRMHCECYIMPSLGPIRLRDLNPETIEALYADLLEHGKTKGGGGLSPQSVHHCHAVLHAALQYLVDKGRLPRNPASLAKAPSVKSKVTMKTWTKEQRRAFLEATKDDRLHGLWVLLSTMGLRRGEALGLRWGDVTFADEIAGDSISISNNLVSVGGKATEGTPKTGSARAVPLPPVCMAGLREQTAQQIRDAEKWGDAWQDTDYVFTIENGQPLHPERATKLFYEAVDSAKLPRIRLHDLRHTAATLARRAGVPIEVISLWLGHASVVMTFNVYSHVQPDAHDDALARVEASVSGRS